MGVTNEREIKRVYIERRGVCKSSNGLQMYIKLVERDANDRKEVCGGLTSAMACQSE